MPKIAARPSETTLPSLLRVLGSEQPTSLRDLRQRGIAAPVEAIYGLELAGVRVERVFGRSPAGQRTFLGFRVR